MSDRLAELGPQAEVFLVMFGVPGRVEAYASRQPLEYPILVDPDRTAYRRFGLGRGSVRRVWGRQAGRRYVQLFRKNGLSGLRSPTEDSLQLGGDFVVDPAGILTYGFWGAGPDDRPAVDDLVAAIADPSTR